ncbi:hypothetical protein [Arenibaculum pallidiluteum]|uniref:hypothetical protein n=1 Tax=Arenibaculum pallidiluteum TaxID=2812559 RepID=UPI001A96C6A7|nr:hypothetical protein [Arenibaculum pallidiluteum]
MPRPTALPSRTPFSPTPLGAGLAAALALAVVLAPGAAAADQAEARDVARAANCQPGKVETLRQIAGGQGETVFKVNCAGGKNLHVLVQCRMRQCVLLR